MEYTSILLLIFVVVFIFSGFVTVRQGTVAVITMFGKYRRIMFPGLNFKVPFIESVFKRISIQNRSIELEFQAIPLLLTRPMLTSKPCWYMPC